MSRFESATNIPTSLDGRRRRRRAIAALEAQLKEAMLEIAELRARDALKTQFLANISHDLRTPLTAVITHAEILRDGILGDLTPRQLESVRGIISGGRQLLNQVGEILTYARGAANQLTLVPTRFARARRARAGERAQRVAAQEEATLARRRRRIGSAAGRSRDREKIAHVVGNLLGNAIDFTPPGGRVWLRAARADARDRPSLRRRSRRHGRRHRVGAPRSDLPRIRAGRFDAVAPAPRHGPRPHDRAASSSSCTADGSGSRASSAQAAGSSSPFRSRHRRTDRQRAMDAQPHVLVVEDNELVSGALRILFESGGYRVSVAASIAADARRRARAIRPMLILLDLTLPDGDGLTLVEPLLAVGMQSESSRSRATTISKRASAVSPRVRRRAGEAGAVARAAARRA